MRPGKRAFDLICSGAGLIVISPLLLAIALAIRIADGKPVFFRQTRAGHRGKPFRIWKFRTMVSGAESLGGPLTVANDQRVTKLGAWLRRTKLDELPQLFNVLRGEMSLVGPRPEVLKYVEQYDQAQRAVLEVVPGITDPASICFRSESELLLPNEDPEQVYVREIMAQKIDLNLEYARSANLASDISVIVRTIFGTTTTKQSR